MTTYNQSYSQFSNIQSRGRQIPPDPNEELICNNCINQSLIDAKRKRDQDAKTQETPMDIQDRLNNLTQNKIFSKVQERIKNSELVAKKFRPQSVEKERLINKNEKGTFFLNDPDVLSNDYQKKRALDNYNRKMKISSSTKKISDKPNVDEYYKKYVDNYKEPEQPKTISKNDIQKNYNDALENQIANNQKLRNRKKREDEERINNEQKRDNENFIKQQNDLAKKKQMLNDEFIRGNRNLIYLKNKKLENEKLQDNYNNKHQISSLQKQLDDEENERKNQELEKKRKLQQDLEKQVREKQKQKELEKKNDNVPYKNTFGQCTCQGTGVCSSCKKTYPLSFLNPKKNYTSLAQARYNKKKSNLKY